MTARPTLPRRALLGAAAATLAAGKARAQAFPTRPIRLICANSAGGTMDLTLRGVQTFLAGQGVKTQLDYVIGGGGNVARVQLATSAPDGYAMMGEYTPSAALGTLVSDSYKSSDLEPVFGWAVEGWAISAKKDGPLKTLADLVTLAKQRPIVAGSIARGSSSHLQLILLRDALGIPMNLVHFSGSAQVYPQIIGGNIDIGCGGPASGSRSADQLQFLCITREHEKALPNVPSAASQGVKMPSIDQIYYNQVRAGTPADRIAKLEAAHAAAFADPGFAQAQERAGLVGVEAYPRARLLPIIKEGESYAEKYRAQLQA